MKIQADVLTYLSPETAARMLRDVKDELQKGNDDAQELHDAITTWVKGHDVWYRNRFYVEERVMDLLCPHCGHKSLSRTLTGGVHCGTCGSEAAELAYL